MNLQQIIATMQMVADDVEQDIKGLENKPFNGKVVGDLLSKQAAIIQAIALSVEELAERVLISGILK